MKNLFKDRVKPIFYDFMEQTAGINDIKSAFLTYYAKIIKIQKSNQARLNSIKCRKALLNDYWDNVRQEMQRCFQITKKNKQKAGKLQVKLIQISD
jgi:hypothetical protein